MGPYKDKITYIRILNGSEMRLLTPSRSRVFLDKLTKLTTKQFLKGEFDISSGPLQARNSYS